MIYLKALKQIFSITFTILMFITLPAVVFTLLSSKTPVLGGFQSFVVMSGSMEPNLPVGSIVYTFKSNSYNVGDVITFKQGKINVTHRIVAVDSDGSQVFYRTKGDANEDVDTGSVTEKQILGEQVYRVWNAGKLIVYMKTLPGFFMFLIFPTLIFISSELWTIKKEFEKEIRKKVIQQIKISQGYA